MQDNVEKLPKSEAHPISQVWGMLIDLHNVAW